MSVDDLVASITPYNPRPLILHGYIGPILALLGLWGWIWFGMLGFWDYFEVGCIGCSLIALIMVVIVLFCHWFVAVQCLLTCSKVKSPLDAKFVRVDPTPNNGSSELVSIRRKKGADGLPRMWFEFQKVHYVFDFEEKKQFTAVQFPVNIPFKNYQEWKGYDTDEDVQTAKDKYGQNEMAMVIPQFMDLFKERATAPFFVFQVFCVALWCLDEYWYYSVFTLIMLVTFEATLVKQQMKNLEEIRNMGIKPYTLQVYRNKRWRPIRSDELLAGDIVSIGRSPNGHPVPCDLLLLRGPCIVDESMLTGESVPQMKEPIEDVDGEHVLDLESDSRLHVLSGGTTVVQHSPPPKTGPGFKSPDNGCICYVLKTGFETSQGKLLRTIMFSAKRVTANNLEAFGFILFLLIFAIAAASYVWIKGSENPDRNKYKLFLECTLILTSVVPPELPIELSLAVNSSLMALQKLGVYCTEPFRIPFAGKVDICCFDKTGTLTTDKLVVEGISGLNGTKEIEPVDAAPTKSIQVLATCHSLVQLDDDMVGDPMEKACLSAIDWVLTKNDSVIAKKSKMAPLKIFHRFHFSSSLKRMSVIAGYMPLGTTDVHHIATVKGAPETIRKMLTDAPESYEKTFKALMREGARVLALGYKPLGQLSHQEVRDISRDDIEQNLEFAGFVVISCPLKPDSKSVIKEISASSHMVTMITGDNPLTACHVAKELRFTRKSHTLILEPNSEGGWKWVSVHKETTFPMVPPKAEWNEFFSSNDFCLTGEGLSYLSASEPEFYHSILPKVQVFARMAPKQKERIITTLKSMGHVTLMCGDGTNDVGALKQAEVGVALLANPLPSRSEMKEKPMQSRNSPVPSQSATKGRKTPTSRRIAQAEETQRMKQNSAQKRLQDLMKEMEAEERAQVVQLGDASIAAPFTSKYSSIQSICHVIKQGRCTLVTTLQMFKILALNALVLAYGQSVLYLDGVKFSDTQATVQGLLLALCFLFISRSKPLKVLAKQRPLPNIFNIYTLLTVTLQFAVHLGCLLFLVGEAHARSPPREDKFINLEESFKPTLLNSTVYIMSMALQITTFAVNYRGHPFMESLWENKTLLYSLLTSGGSVLALASGVVPELTTKFELLPFENEFRNLILMVLAVDLVGCYAIDRICQFIFGDVRVR